VKQQQDQLNLQSEYPQQFHHLHFHHHLHHHHQNQNSHLENPKTNVKIIVKDHNIICFQISNWHNINIAHWIKSINNRQISAYPLHSKWTIKQNRTNPRTFVNLEQQFHPFQQIQFWRIISSILWLKNTKSNKTLFQDNEIKTYLL
jgi:hypothetical protein